MSLSTLQRLFAHMRWADRLVQESLQGSAGSNFERAIYLYCHILGAEHVWLARLEQHQATVAVWPELNLADCARLAQANHAGFEDYLNRLEPAALQRDIPYVNSKGQSFRSTAEDILLHVSLHGTYHRGQVSLLVRDGGGIPSPTDFIGYIRGVPAASTRIGP